VQRGAEAKTDDSGIVDFKMIASLDPLAEERAKSTPLADQGLFDDDEKKADVPAPVSSANGVSTAPVSAPPSSAPKSAPKSSPAVAAVAASDAKKEDKEKKKTGSGGTIAFIFGGVVLIGAVAASAMFYVKNHEYPWTAFTRPKAVDVAPVVAPPPIDTAPAVAQNDTPQPTVGDPGVTPTVAPKPGVKGPIHVGPAPKPGPTVDPKLTVKDLPPSQGGGGNDLTKAMRDTVGPIDTSNNPTPAAGGGGGGGGGNVAQHPSQGMVQGAVNAVLPAARSCLGPDDPVSKATVVFQSDGTVQSVAVSGSASGKPAEQCIKNALSKAKVTPFAESTFTFPVTVRPSG
jgi:hypothetical protein